MGWTSSLRWRGPRDVRVAALRESYSPGAVMSSTPTSNGRHVWVLVERNAVRCIDLILIEGGHNGGWAYKVMPEAFQPFHFDCPLALLAEAPEVSPGWRARVRAFHEAAAKSYKVGDTVTVYGKQYEVVDVMAGRVLSYLIRNSRGKVYKTTAGKMSPVVVQATGPAVSSVSSASA